MNKVVTRVGETRLTIVRTYDAPAPVVYAAMTEPEQLRAWLSAGGVFDLVACEKDLRPGGGWRNVLRSADNTEIALSGRYLEVTRDRRLMFTEDFGDFRGEMIVTVDLDELDGGTKATTTVEFATTAIRDAVIDGDTIDESDGIYALLAAHVSAHRIGRLDA